MDIYVRVKAIGKRKDILAPTPYTIPDGICSLRQLLTAVVKKEVAQYVIDHIKATVDISEVLLEIEELRKAIESLGK